MTFVFEVAAEVLFAEEAEEDVEEELVFEVTLELEDALDEVFSSEPFEVELEVPDSEAGSALGFEEVFEASAT